MHSSTFTLASADGLAHFIHRWLPEATPKAVVQIAHGLVEHAGRYARVAAALTRVGYAVYAGDHRGHGRTAPTPEDLGFFAERDGWRKCVDDLWGLNQRIAADHPGLPIVLIGHSMGSFMAQHFMRAWGGPLRRRTRRLDRQASPADCRRGYHRAHRAAALGPTRSEHARPLLGLRHLQQAV